MNVVWMIGNGFDLACGMKTRYSDFFASNYVQANKNNQIYDNIQKDIESWADFELALGKLSQSIDEKNVVGFINDIKECYSDFQKYIENEEAQLDKIDIGKFRTDLIVFYGLPRPIGQYGHTKSYTQGKNR